MRARYVAYERRISVPKPYGIFGFLGDVFMTIITGGLWLIYVFVREMRSR